jgi:hypothetical protein
MHWKLLSFPFFGRRASSALQCLSQISSGIFLGAPFNAEVVLLGQSTDAIFDAAEPTKYQHRMARSYLRRVVELTRPKQVVCSTKAAEEYANESNSPELGDGVHDTGRAR